MKQHDKLHFAEWIITTLFFVLFYLYFWLWIQPVLHYQSQQPVFFFGQRFFNQFLTYPGGLSEYLASFLSQFYYFSWAGALVITLLGCLLYLETRILAKLTTGVKTWHLTHFIPSMMFLSMHSRYHHALSMSLSLILMLGFLMVYIRISKARPLFRLISYFILAGIVYYTTAGQFLFFAVFCGLIELYTHRRYTVCMVYILSALVFPYTAYTFLFIMNLRNAYFHLLPFGQPYLFFLAPYLLYGFYPILFLANANLRIPTQVALIEKTANRFSIIRQKAQSVYQKGKISFQILILILAAGIVAWFSFESEKKPFLQICFYARQQMWNQVLTIAQSKKPTHILAQYHINRALYHTDRLAKDMFAYAQDWGVGGLILPQVYITAPLQKSDVYFELGHMNEAHRWAHEALTILGDTPWTLQQLAWIHFFKGETEASQKYFNILKTSLLFRNWAQQNERYIVNDSLLPKDIRLKEIYTNINRTDFFTRVNDPLFELETLFENNPSNQMAFEYLMAGYLLTGQISQLSRNIRYLKTLGYQSIPRLYEEALFIFLVQTNPELLKAKAYQFSRNMLVRFTNMQEILFSHSNNKNLALKELEKQFGNSYWFYVIQKNLKLQ